MTEFMMHLRFLAEQRRLKDLEAEFERQRLLSEMELYAGDDDEVCDDLWIDEASDCREVGGLTGLSSETFGGDER
ncbi:MAG: hypothetical protein RMK89_05890 [Armatimonadota bacterium]|nr:hypothetical protein [Armatimonadota bacterium]MDW8142978.1 hypothetical protein [Armatimonadota bacterium]